MADISISGTGFYQIVGESKRGRSFMRCVEGSDKYGVAYSDMTGLVQAIADAAHNKGLLVTVNGRRYLGHNRVAS